MMTSHKMSARGNVVEFINFPTGTTLIFCKLYPHFCNVHNIPCFTVEQALLLLRQSQQHFLLRLVNTKFKLGRSSWLNTNRSIVMHAYSILLVPTYICFNGDVDNLVSQHKLTARVQDLPVRQKAGQLFIPSFYFSARKGV